jgi:hypothetical protein
MTGKVYERKMDTRKELLARILAAAACIKKRENQLRRTTHHLSTRAAVLIGADSGFSNLYFEL